MSDPVYVAGVGMLAFRKPGQADAYDVMGAEAARLALDDAGLDYDQVKRGYVGYVYADSTAGQAALYPLGLTGIPVVNVNNNCATGATALFLAREAIATGAADIVLALGFEQMSPGALGSLFSDRPSPLARTFQSLFETEGFDHTAPPTAQLFAGAANDYHHRYGLEDLTLASIAEKSRRHAGANPLAIFREPVSAADVLASPVVFGRLTRLQCCPPTSGAAAAILVSKSAADRLSLSRRVEIIGQSMVTDTASSFDDASMMKLVGYDLSRAAADDVYAQSGIDVEDVDLVELHDCFTVNELISYEALRLCDEGEGARFVADGENTHGGQVAVNPSGGLLSKGHPLGATGMAQCAEITWQLRGAAEARQVGDARIGLQHNIGIGGACVVTAYRRAG